MNLRVRLAVMDVRKERILFAALGFLAGILADQPRHSVPPHWQNGLLPDGAGHFIIRREGDVTLKYVSASLAAGDLELVPVPHYQEQGPRTESVREIARRYGLETNRTVIAAINGGFFDTKTGLPIGFLLRNEKMEFFNMPQGFTRSMIGFSPSHRGKSAARVHISSPRQMPKVWLDTLTTGVGGPARTAKVPVHHVNIPGGKNALSLFTSTYGKTMRVPPNAVYIVAQEEPKRRGVYKVTERMEAGTIPIPQKGLLVALHGDARASASYFKPGTIVRPGWSLPPDWARQGVTHALLAGPRLLEKGVVQVTAREERLDKIKSRDRVALGVKPNGDTLLLWAHKNTQGDLSFETLAEILTRMGAQDAIALDGGGSRAIFAQQGGAPADDRYFEGGRPVANAIVLALPSGPRS